MAPEDYKMKERLAETSPRAKAKIAGAFYLLTIMTGMYAVFADNRRYSNASNLMASLCYIVVTLLFYNLFKPVNRGLSLLAVFFSLVGCAFGALSQFHFIPTFINPIVFFGFYCLLIGHLIFRSTFLPRFLGVLLGITGLGWLTFLSQSLSNRLSPYVMVSGLIGEGALTVWLLVVGVNVTRWKEQATVSPSGYGF